MRNAIPNAKAKIPSKGKAVPVAPNMKAKKKETNVMPMMKNTIWRIIATSVSVLAVEMSGSYPPWTDCAPI